MAAVTMMSAGFGQWTFAETKGGIPYRTLGRTGERVSIMGIGGYHPGEARFGVTGKYSYRAHPAG
jgi:hypothetical protein